MTRSKKSKKVEDGTSADGQQQHEQQQQEQPAQQMDQQQDGQQQGAGKKEGGKRNDACCVFVGNVSFTTTWQKLKDVMRKAGDVDLVELVVDSSHKPKGSALVSFKNECDAKTAVGTLNGTVVDGREILVRSYEKGARPLVIYGNYTREQLVRVLPKDKQQGGPGGAPQQGGGQPGPHHQGHHGGGPHGGMVHQHGGHHHHHHHHGGGGHMHHMHQHGGHHHHHHHGHHGHHMQHGGAPLGGDRVSLRHGGNGGNGGRPGEAWRVNDGGDFNKRNRDTFGDEAVSYRAHGNGVPTQGPAPGPEATAAAMAAMAGGGNMGGGGGAAMMGGGGANDRKKLFVSNLPFSCSWKLLKDTFSQVGKVLRADIIMDDRGRSRGMGTVVFASTDEALKAIEEFDGIEMEGRPMGVRLDRDYLGPH